MSVKNQNSIVTDGLVFYVDAGNENSYPGSGTTWSDLIGSNDGAFQPIDGPVYGSENGGNIAFDGADDCVNFNNLIPCPNLMSINVWAKRNSTTVQSMFLSSHGAHQQQFQFKTTGENALYFVINTGGTFSPTASATLSTDTTAWVNFAGTYDGTTVKLYINGVLNETNSSGPSGNIRNAGQNMELMLGCRDASSNKVFYNGDLACASIYDRALTASEITQNYNALKNRFI